VYLDSGLQHRLVETGVGCGEFLPRDAIRIFDHQDGALSNFSGPGLSREFAEHSSSEILAGETGQPPVHAQRRCGRRPPPATPRPRRTRRRWGQDGGAVTPDKVQEGAVRAPQDEPSAAFTPAAPRPKAQERHGYRPRPPARPQPTFWQRLFGHKEPKTAKPGKPQQ
jgi:hypothetical protein